MYKVLVELEHGASIEEAEKFIKEKMKEKNIKGKIIKLVKNNFMSFMHESGNYFFDVEIETIGGACPPSEV